MQINQMLAEMARKYNLSPPETEAFLAWFESDMNQEQVIQRLNLSLSTFTRHMTNVYQKFSIGGDNPGKSKRLLHFLLREGVKLKATATMEDNKNNDLAPTNGQADKRQNSRSHQLIEPKVLYYVERPPTEALCREAILQPGALIRVKAPRQRGKTLLLTTILDYAERQGYRSAYLNLCLPEVEIVQNLERFLRWFCLNLSQQLELPHQLNEYWDESFGLNDNCTIYLKDYLLATSEQPLLICLDNVDRLFPYSIIAQEFLGLLRTWRETAQVFKDWAKLRLVVAHSTEVYVPLDVKRSPFNVGMPIQLSEFNQTQVAELAQNLQLSITASDIEQLTQTVGGHPWMVYQAFMLLRTEPQLSLEALLRSAATESGLYSNHLRNLWTELQESSDLLTAMQAVISQKKAVQLKPEQAYRLDSLGIVRWQGNTVIAFCDIYQQYFNYRFKTL